MKYVELCGKQYPAKEFDFNMICDLEDMGINIDKAAERPMSLVRAYVSFCINGSLAAAGKMIENHMKTGDITSIIDVMSEMMDESDFFRTLSKDQETEIAETQEEVTETKKKNLKKNG